MPEGTCGAYRRSKHRKCRQKHNRSNKEHVTYTTLYDSTQTGSKLARVWTRTSPSGEPGEPRWHIAKQRTPSPKPEVEAKQNITDKNHKRNRNYKRGIRSEVATNRRKTKHLMKQSEERR